MNQPKHEGSKMFLIAFVLTFLLLALIMVGTVLAVQPSMPQAASSAPDEPLYHPVASDSLTLAVIYKNAGGATDFWLMRFNPQHGQIPLLLFPPDTVTTQDGQDITLEDIYGKRGGEGIKDALSVLLSTPVDRYAELTRESLLRLAKQVGSVEYTLPYDITYSRDGYPVSLTAGLRRLDGQDMADLLAYPALRKNPITRCELLGGMVAAWINQHLDMFAQEQSSALYKLAVNLLKTDLNAQDYELRRESAHFLSGMQPPVAGHLPLSGTDSERGFVVSEELVGQVGQFFGQLS